MKVVIAASPGTNFHDRPQTQTQRQDCWQSAFTVFLLLAFPLFLNPSERTAIHSPPATVSKEPLGQKKTKIVENTRFCISFLFVLWATRKHPEDQEIQHPERGRNDTN